MTPTSAYLLIFREAAPERYEALSAEQKQRLLTEWTEWYEELAAARKVQQGHPLVPEGRVVFAARGGRITEGPLAETKEAIGGFFYLTVNDLEEATQIARACPTLRYGTSIEVRAVADCCRTLGSLKTAQSVAVHA